MSEKKFSVIFTDYDYENIEIEKDVLKEIDCEIISLQSADEDILLKACRYADAIITQYAPITLKVIDSMEKCKVISRYGIGVDNINTVAARTKGIPVCNVPDYCTNEVADHALALMFSLGRKTVLLSNSVRAGTWDLLKIAKPIYNFNKLILGLVGFGKIPQNLYEKTLKIFNEVKVFDPFISPEIVSDFNLKLVSFYELLRTCDFISIHCPLNAGTRHLFGIREFQLMKPTAYLINTARGGVINTQDLYQAIKNGLIAGAGLDVLEKEPPGMDFELAKFDNIIITPHTGFYSESSLVELKYTAAVNILKVLKGEKPINLVN
jgi:D-3-phosphoglycerate dehydrogenase / 2-oxoglutarate reductase